MKAVNFVRFATLLLWGAAFFSVPMFMGYGRGEIGVALAIASIAVSSLVLILKRNFFIRREVFVVGIVTLIFCIAAASITYIIGNASNSANIAINMVIISLAVSVASILCIGQNPEVVLRSSQWVLRFVIGSGLISSALLLSGLAVDTLTLAEIDVANRGDNFKVALLFPGGTNPFIMTTPYGVFYRATFWCIEPGVAVFLITLWRYLDTSTNGTIERVKDGVFFLALLTTLSTTAPIALGLYFFGRLYVGKGSEMKITTHVLALIIVGGSLYLFLFFPAFGFYEKLGTHSTSFSARLGWYTEDDGALMRTLIISVLVAHLVAIFYLVGRRSLLLTPTIFLVAVLNVLEFSAIYILSLLVLSCAEPKLATIGNCFQGRLKLKRHLA